jgi:uncharacterized protein YcbX
VRISALHLHPVKGCHRIEVDRALVGPYGLVGDREWQLVAEDGDFVTQRRRTSLTRIHPALAEGGLVLRAEGRQDLEVARPAVADTPTKHYSGEALVGDAGDEAAAWCSEVVGEPVRLVGIAPGYERNTGLFTTESNLGDAAPVTVVTDASHEFLAERAKEPFGPERWRINVFVAGGEAWAEDTWREIRLGDATAHLVLPWPRCAVPQVDQEDGTRHKEPAAVLKQHRWCAELPNGTPLEQAILCGNALFGMAGSIEPVGATIAVGDEVSVVGTGPSLL